MLPKITVIIPVYNAENYLVKCFESILENKYDNLEIIPVNDGSKDNSQKIIEEYKNKYPNIFYPIIQENQGIGMARNNALKKATGKYVMFIDNDDYIEKDYFQKHIEQIQKEDYDMVLSGYKRVNSDNKELFSVTLDESYRWSRYISIAPWGRLYKLEFLKNNSIEFLKTPIGEDVYFNLQANTLAKKVKVIDYKGYNWYYNGTSVTNTINTKITRINIIDLLNTHYGILKEKNCINNENEDIITMYFLLLIIQFLQWLAKLSTYDEIKINYKLLLNWFNEKFKNNKKVNYWKISKGDRIKIRMIILIFSLADKMRLGTQLIWIYKKIG